MSHRRDFLGVVLVVVAAILLAGCTGTGGSATILDVPLHVSLTSVHLTQKKPHPDPALPIGFHISISNPSDQSIYANDCHARGYDERGRFLYDFTFALGIGGAQMNPHGTYTSNWRTYAMGVTPDEVRATARTTATCQAWDWHGNPPI